MEEVLKTLKSIDGRLTSIDGRLDGIDGRIDSLEGLIGSLAISTANGFDELRGEMNEGFEKVDSKLGGLQRAVDAGFERTGSLEARVVKIETEL